MITKEVQITIKLPQRHLRKHLNAPQTPPTPHQTFPKTPSDIFAVVIGTYPKVVFANVQCTLCTTHQPPFAQQYCSQNENLLHQPTCCVNWWGKWNTYASILKDKPPTPATWSAFLNTLKALSWTHLRIFVVCYHLVFNCSEEMSGWFVSVNSKPGPETHLWNSFSFA